MALFHGKSQVNGYVTAVLLISIWLIILTAIQISLVFNTSISYLLAIVVIGIGQRYLEEISHQAMHRHLFTRLRLNDQLDFLYSIPLFYTIKGERRQHFLHHKELAAEQAKKNYSYDHLGIMDKGMDYQWYRIFVLFIQPFLGSQAFLELKNIILNSRKYFFSCYVYHLVFLTLLAYEQHASIYLYYWLVPYFSVYCLLYYYSELFTHFGCREEIPSRDTENWMVNLFIGPLGFCRYHTLHHLVPKIPWHKYAIIRPLSNSVSNEEKNRQNLQETFREMLKIN